MSKPGMLSSPTIFRRASATARPKNISAASPNVVRISALGRILELNFKKPKIASTLKAYPVKS